MRAARLGSHSRPMRGWGSSGRMLAHVVRQARRIRLWVRSIRKNREPAHGYLCAVCKALSPAVTHDTVTLTQRKIMRRDFWDKLLSPLSIRMGLEQKGQASVGTSYLPPNGRRNLWQVYVWYSKRSTTSSGVHNVSTNSFDFQTHQSVNSRDSITHRRRT